MSIKKLSTQTFNSKKSTARVDFTTYEAPEGLVFILKGFRSKRHRKGTWIIRTNDKAKAINAGTRWMKSQDDLAEEKAKIKAERKALNSNVEQTFVEGAILVSSWGYEQTNIDFFKVVRRTKSMVHVIELCNKTVEATDFMSSRVIPSEETRGEVMKKRVQCYGGEEKHIKINSSSYARLWDGKPRLQTSYH